MSERWIEWVEPFFESDPVYMRVSESAAVRSMRHAALNSPREYEYKSDEEALEDFMVVHWATFVVKE